MKTYIISLNGCDDSTVFKMKLNDDELHLVERICKMSKSTSEYCCMPVMTVEEYDKDDVWHNSVYVKEEEQSND